MRLTERPLLGRPEDLAAENREITRLRAQVADVRALAEKAPQRWLGWSVERPDGSSSFGTFSRLAPAERVLADVQRGLCPDARIVDCYALGSLDANDVLTALDGAS